MEMVYVSLAVFSRKGARQLGDAHLNTAAALESGGRITLAPTDYN